jgi:hypothetical protein
VSTYKAYKDKEGSTIYEIPVEAATIDELISMVGTDPELEEFLYGELGSNELVETRDGMIYSGSDIQDFLPKRKASLNKKAEETDDYLLRYIGEYFQPDAEQKEFLDVSGEDEDSRLDFWDELMDMLESNPDFSEYGSWEEEAEDSGMDVYDLLYETLDDWLNTSYSYPYEDLPDDEIGKLIKQKLDNINNSWRTYQSEKNASKKEASDFRGNAPRQDRDHDFTNSEEYKQKRNKQDSKHYDIAPSNTGDGSKYPNGVNNSFGDSDADIGTLG